MKKFIAGLLFGFLLATTSSSLAGTNIIRLYVNGQEIIPDVPPQNINGRVMVPARFIAEPLGASVEWDAATNAVKITSQVSKESSPTPKKEQADEQKQSDKLLNMGEKFQTNGLTVTIKKIDYTDDGFNVYFSVINNTDKPLENPGSLSFKLTEPMYEEEINRIGCGICFDKTGYIYPGESCSGHYQYRYKRPIQFESVTYSLNHSGIAGAPLATWKVR
jgi:hypothetical protein